MVVQYLIDWENLLPDANGYCSERLCEQVLRLMAAIRRNGLLVNSAYVEKVISQRRSIDNNRLIDRVLDEVNAVYRDFGERVDSSNPANSLNDTIDRWKAYLRETGVNFVHNDFRCILVGGAGRRGGTFYGCQSLEDAFEASSRWTRLLHFDHSTRFDFRRYIEAFSAAAKDYVRIYDPYLSNAFKNVRCAPNVKAWRNSLYYILGVVLRNRHIKTVDVVTEDNIEQFRFKEVIDDIIIPCSSARGDGNAAEVAFHLIDNRRSFHDRFLSNGRFCFAIGHGCDVCEADDQFRELSRQNNGDHGFALQWRNMPQSGTERFADFNVFYGCSKNDVPLGIRVFAERRANINGESIIYPIGCRARRFEDIRTQVGNNGIVVSRFAGLPENQENPVFANQSVKVSVNPLTGDDF